jgi:hypothetical protein
LEKKFIDDIKDAPKHDPYKQDDNWTKNIMEHFDKYPNDPVTFPFNDPDPQVSF